MKTPRYCIDPPAVYRKMKIYLIKVNIFANIFMKWVISYYNNKVFQSIANLPTKMCARYLALADTMIENGPNLGMPHTRAMGEGLYEMRIKAKEGIARVFYGVQLGQEIVMLHHFIKKTQHTPFKELVIARKRLQEIESG